MSTQFLGGEKFSVVIRGLDSKHQKSTPANLYEKAIVGQLTESMGGLKN